MTAPWLDAEGPVGPVAAIGNRVENTTQQEQGGPTRKKKHPGPAALPRARQALWEGLFLAVQAAGAGLVWPCCLAA